MTTLWSVNDAYNRVVDAYAAVWVHLETATNDLELRATRNEELRRLVNDLRGALVRLDGELARLARDTLIQE